MTSSGFFKKKARRPERFFTVRFFNMVEVALALAVVAIGVVSIVALFPVGMNAARDAIADSYAADLVDTFLHYQAAVGKKNWTSIDALKSSSVGVSSDNSGTAWTDKGFIPNTSTRYYDGGAGLFKIKQQAGTASGSLVDFSGVFRMWRSNVTYSYYDPTESAPSARWKSATLDSSKAVGLNVEVSWPAEAPYLARQRALYYLEVFNPN